MLADCSPAAVPAANRMPRFSAQLRNEIDWLQSFDCSNIYG
jgi:hypothetical protein